MRFYYDKRRVNGIDDLVRAAEKDLHSATISTAPLLSMMKHKPELLLDALELDGLQANPSEIAMHVEYTVEPPRGRGKPSYTDLVVRTPDRATAVEAKWTEPRYESCARWRKRGADPANRTAVLEGWVSLLNRWAANPVGIDDLADLPYQLVHRGASACSFESAPTLVYLQFVPLPDGRPTRSAHVRTDLKRLQERVASDDFSTAVVEVTLSPTGGFRRLECLTKRTPETRAAVVTALLDGPLFEFDKPEHR